MISIVINCMTTHGCSPAKFMETLLIVIIKHTEDDNTGADNYNPTASISIAFTILELIILYPFLDKLGSTCNQIGF